MKPKPPQPNSPTPEKVAAEAIETPQSSVTTPIETEELEQPPPSDRPHTKPKYPTTDIFDRRSTSTIADPPPTFYGSIDGISYPNAHNDEEAIALYERSQPALTFSCKYMTYQLRLYQKQTIVKIADAWQRKRKRVLAVAPTGAGKTIIFAKLIDDYLTTNPDRQVLIVAHREEIILQAQTKVAAFTTTPIGIIKSGYPEDLSAPIQIASIQTLARHLDLLDLNPRIIIIDEAHHAVAESYRALFTKFPNSYILGMTATPMRTDGLGFDELFDELVTAPSVAELILQGYLSPFKIYGAKRIQVKDTKIRFGDYDRQQLLQDIDRSLVYGDLIEAYQQYAPNRKTIVFCADVAYSERTAAAYRSAGIAAEHIDGETPTAERKAILDRFRSGQTRVLTNCELILEGFDLDDIEAIQIVRPTASLGLYLQMVGRVLRPHADKSHAIIIDHTANVAQFDLPDYPHLWTLEPISASGGSQWLQRCPRCGHIFRCAKHERQVQRQTRQGIPRQFAQANCPCCQTKFEFLIQRSGLLFNADIPVRIVTEIERAPIVELTKSNRPQLAPGNPAILAQKTIERTIKYIHPDQLKIIHNVIDANPIALKAAEELGKLPMTEDFSFSHWQYIAAKLGYRGLWAKTAFYKYTVRKRLKIRTDRPEENIDKIYWIAERWPSETVIYPDNWTSDREAADKYLQMALAQGKKYYAVPLVRSDGQSWKVLI